jgi:hypothetical protein
MCLKIRVACVVGSVVIGCLSTGCHVVDVVKTPIRVEKLLPPTFKFAADTQVVQKRGGVVMRLEPFVNRVHRREVESRENELFGQLHGVQDGRKKTELITSFELVKTPKYELDPPNLMFSVKITNQLGHTLRLAESIVNISVNGAEFRVRRDGHAEFLNAIIPRGHEEEVFITGPRFETLSDVSTIRIAIDDVVTEVDEANNATKRTHFEWILTYRKSKVSESDYIQRQYFERRPSGDLLPIKKIRSDPNHPWVKKLPFIGYFIDMFSVVSK